MRVKTSELIGPALDWAVAECEDQEMAMHMGLCGAIFEGYHYSTNWSQGGPIIKKRGIWLRGPNDATKPDGTVVMHVDYWYAHINHKHVQNDMDPLIAAMRVVVASELGDWITVPNVLVGTLNGV